MSSLLHSLALPFFRGRFGGVGARLTLPRPDDAPWAHAPGVDPDRILIFGNGAAVGWGVRSHDLALPGHLARQVSALTGRGNDVDLVADPTMTSATASRAVPISRVASYDAVVVVIGMSDALRMTSPARYRADLASLLSLLMAHRHTGAEIALVAIHRPSSLGVFSLKRGSALDQHAELLNAEAADLCEHLPGVRFITMAERGEDLDETTRTHAAPDLFRTMAATLAAHLLEPLDAQFSTGRESCPMRFSPQSDEDRARAIRGLGLVDPTPERRFDDIVDRARILLAASSAAFAVIDGDTIWNKAVSGDGTVEFPLRGAMCAETIRTTGPLIVSDVWADDRFVTHPSVRFYAGYPIEGPGGVRIGALCVTDPQPRPADSVDLVLLRELALAVQRELTQAPVALGA